jgi:hypothetical protein
MESFQPSHPLASGAELGRPASSKRELLPFDARVAAYSRKHAFSFSLQSKLAFAKVMKGLTLTPL